MYSDFISRNSLYINKSTQNKIRGTKIFIAGCGLGSVIAEVAVRVGFRHFIIADGDKVESSNLNRQFYTANQVGKNKARCLAKNLKSISTDVHITVIDKFLNSINEIKKITDKSNFIINTVDFDSTFFHINKVGVKNNNTVFFPLNIGFGGFLMIFNKYSADIEKVVNKKSINDEKDFFKQLLVSLENFKLPQYLKHQIAKIVSEKEVIGYNSQLCMAAKISSSLVLTSMIKILAKQKVKLAPKAYFIDTFDPGKYGD